eukprot:evm.model.scf_4499.1 EVM.evm.TU.scf_4499.1   scf_4499:3875-6565(+)
MGCCVIAAGTPGRHRQTPSMVVFTEAWNVGDAPMGHSKLEDAAARGGCLRSRSSLSDCPTAPTVPRKDAGDPARSIEGAEPTGGRLPVQLKGAAKRDGRNGKTGSADAVSSAENGSAPECDVLGMRLRTWASRENEASMGVPIVNGCRGRRSGSTGCWYLPAFIHFTCGPLGDVADSAALVFPVYLLLIAPFSLYMLHDVLDARWRSTSEVFGWQRMYLAFNAIVTVVLAMYAVVQGCGEDYKEVAATILVLVVGWVGAWKAIRGFMIHERFTKLQGNSDKLVRIDDDDIKINKRGIRDLISAKLFDDDYPGEGPRIKFITGYLARVAGCRDYQEIVDPKDLALTLVGWIGTAHEVILDDTGGAIVSTAATRVWNWMACTYGFRVALLARETEITVDRVGNLHFQFVLGVNAIRRMLFLDPTDRGTDLFQVAEDHMNYCKVRASRADENALPADGQDTGLVDSLSAFLGFAVSKADEVDSIKEVKQAFMKLLVNLCPVAATEVNEAEGGLPVAYSNEIFLIHIVYLLLRDHVFFSAKPLPQLKQFDDIFSKIQGIRDDCKNKIVERLQAIVNIGANHDAAEYLYSEAANFGTYVVKRVLYAEHQHDTTSITCDMEPTQLLWRFIRIWEIAVTDMVTILMGEHKDIDKWPLWWKGQSIQIYDTCFKEDTMSLNKCAPLASGTFATVREVRFFHDRDQPHKGWSAERASNTQLAVAGLGWYHPDEWNRLVENGQMDQLDESGEALVPLPERLSTTKETIHMKCGDMDACWRMMAAYTTRQGGYHLGAATEPQYPEWGVIISCPHPVWQANYGAISHVVREIGGNEKLQPWMNWSLQTIQLTFRELENLEIQKKTGANLRAALEAYPSLMDPTAYDEDLALRAEGSSLDVFPEEAKDSA